MERLTKENFWNDLNNKYPEIMWKFKTWIDEYKKSVAWKILFNDESEIKVGSKIGPKYHDLPYAMQVGIFLQFVAENKETKWGVSINMKTMEDFLSIKEVIREYIVFEESDNIPV